MSPHEMTIIARFARANGVIPWQGVAAILGRNANSLRAEYDSLSMVPVTLTPDNIGPVDSLPEPACYRSTRAKANLRMAIMGLIRHRTETVNVLAERIGSTPVSVRNRLLQLYKDGVADPDGGYPGRPGVQALWGLTVFGREVYDREQKQERAA